MPLPVEAILLDQGLNQVADPALAADGELRVAEDTEYRANDRTLWKVKGRAKFNSSPEDAAIQSGIWLDPQGATPSPVFLIQKGTKWRTATPGYTGSFSDAVTGLTGSDVLDAAHLASHFFIGNGVDRNRVYGPDFTSFGLHGMLDNTTAPTVASTGSGTGFTLTSGSTILYWIEERVYVSGVLVKRSAAPEATIATLTGTGALVKPVVTRPTTLNSDATHWALFGTSTNGTWPIGAEIGEVVIGTTTIEDTRTGTDPTFPSGATYPIASVIVEGVAVVIPKYGQPQIFSSCDVYADCLVTNSSTDPLGLYFSYTGNGHIFTGANRIRLGDGKNPGRMTLVRQVGNVLVCAFETQAWIIYRLPHPDDKLFQTSRIKAKLEGAYGCVGELAGDTFPLDDRTVVAWVSPVGIVTTDGADWDLLSDDVDWLALIEPSRLQHTVLRYNPQMFRLEMAYTPLGGTANTKMMYFAIHASHLKPTHRGLRAKVTGPINRGATGAFSAIVDGQWEFFTTTTGGYLVRENTGTENEIESTLAMDAITKRYFLAGPGHEVGLKRCRIHHRGGVTGQEILTTIITRSSGRPAGGGGSRNIPVEESELTPFSCQAHGETHEWRFQNSDALGQVGVNYILPEIEGGSGAGDSRAAGSRK